MAHRVGSRVFLLPFAVLVLALFVALGAGPDRAFASDSLLPVQTDTVCASDCGARGYEGEYCTRACAVPPASSVPADTLTDLRCQAKCRKRGGTYSTCHRECTRS